MYSEDRIGIGCDTRQTTIECGANHCARVLDFHALAFTVRPSRPAGIDEPAIRFMLCYPLSQQLGQPIRAGDLGTDVVLGGRRPYEGTRVDAHHTGRRPAPRVRVPSVGADGRR